MEMLLFILGFIIGMVFAMIVLTKVREVECDKCVGRFRNDNTH